MLLKEMFNTKSQTEKDNSYLDFELEMGALDLRSLHLDDDSKEKTDFMCGNNDDSYVLVKCERCHGYTEMKHEEYDYMIEDMAHYYCDDCIIWE